MTDDRLWWQKRLAITDGTVVTVSKPGWVAKKFADSHRVGARSVQSAVHEFQCHGSSSPMEDVAACLIYAYVAARNPALSDREILGLPKEEPAPAKPMTKAEIAAELRRVFEDYRRGNLIGIAGRLGLLVEAVEALPEPDAAKVSPFAERVAKELDEDRHAYPVKQTNLEMARVLVRRAHTIIRRCIETIPQPLQRSDCEALALLATSCQRAAEDLGLIEKQ